MDAPLPSGGAVPPVLAPRDGDTALVVHTSGTTAAPRPVELSFGNVQANALGSAVALGPGPRRALAVPAAALARRRADGAAALRDLRDARGDRRAPSGPAPTTSRSSRSSRPSCGGCWTRARARVRACAWSCSAARRPRPTCSSRRARPAGPCAPPTGSRRRARRSRSTGGRCPGWRVTLAERRRDPRRGTDGRRRRRRCARATSAASPRTGALEIVGRRSDTIVTGGENVAPAEVEAALLAHPAVADAAVFGRPDPEWGEAVTASVVLREPADPHELREWVAGAARALQGAQVGRGGARRSRATHLGSCCAGSCDERGRQARDPRPLGPRRRRPGRRTAR